MCKKMISIVLVCMLFISGCTNQYAKNDKQTVVNVNEGGKQKDKEKDKEKYHVKSNYLKHPDLIKEAANQSAAFWIKTYDEEDGGFYTYINRDGSVDENRPYKIAFLQSRDVYGLVRAYQLTGKKEYLDYARKGLDFMYQNAWDAENGGWYQTLNKDGTLAASEVEGMNWNDLKFTFNQFYCLVGISAMYEVTKNEKDKEWLEKSYAAIEKHLWDSRPEYKGYYEMASKGWNGASGKSFGISMDAIITHLMPMFLNEMDCTYKDRFVEAADNIIKASKTMDERDFGIVEGYDSDWKPMEDYAQTNSGVFLKPAWALAMVYLTEQKPEYKEASQKLIDELLSSKAYDYVNGGPYNTLDPKTGIPIDNKKNWWVLEQGVTAGLTNYYISNDMKSLKMADESIEFYMNHMYDKEYGEVYGEADANGENPDTMKGNYWKGGYHSMELFYYTYLYGNLMLNRKPVSLYYNIEPTDKPRTITLSPVALSGDILTIKSVTLDGKPYKGFGGAVREIKIPAHTGGEFKVVFEPVKPIK